MSTTQQRQVIYTINGYFHNVPCHTQAVERGMQLVTEASGLVSRERNRDGLIQTKVSSRNKNPKFETKKEVDSSWLWQNSVHRHLLVWDIYFILNKYKINTRGAVWIIVYKMILSPIIRDIWDKQNRVH